MAQPAAPVRYTVVALVGPDGAGKTSLLQALGAYLQRRDGLPAPPLRAVQPSGWAATVLDTRSASGVYQLVDFASAAAEPYLLTATPFQGAILVVSALDSVQPGTVQSLQLARQAGIQRVAVAITQCDRALDPELLELVTMEVRALLDKYELAGAAAPVGLVAASAEGHTGERWTSAIARWHDAVLAWMG